MGERNYCGSYVIGFDTGSIPTQVRRGLGTLVGGNIGSGLPSKKADF